MEFWKDPSDFRVEEMKVHLGGIHGEDIEVCFLLAAQNQHKWRTASVRFSDNNTICLNTMEESYNYEALLNKFTNVMVWLSRQAKKKYQAEKILVLLK